MLTNFINIEQSILDLPNPTTNSHPSKNKLNKKKSSKLQLYQDKENEINDKEKIFKNQTRILCQNQILLDRSNQIQNQSQSRNLFNVDSKFKFHLNNNLNNNNNNFKIINSIKNSENLHTSGPSKRALVSSSSNVSTTPVTRRRLAVEGIRKAASNAAVRKMGLIGELGWDQSVNNLTESINYVKSFHNSNNLKDDDEHSSKTVDNGSTTPCDSSFASEDEVESNSIILVHVDTNEGSTTPQDTSYDMDHSESILFDDLNQGTTTPLYDTSFSLDHSESDIFINVNGGSTTPCDSSLNSDDSNSPFAFELDGINPHQSSELDDHLNFNGGSTTPLDSSFDTSDRSLNLHSNSSSPLNLSQFLGPRFEFSVTSHDLDPIPSILIFE